MDALERLKSIVDELSGSLEYLAYLEAAVDAAGFVVKHDGGSLGDSNFRLEPKVPSHPVAWVDIANWRAGIPADECFFSDYQDQGTTPLYAAPATAAPTLDAELAQDRMSELCALERDVLDSLPAVYYMDPPDGGDVSLGEQVKRMAEDAALWRKHSSAPAAPGIDLATAWAEGYKSGVMDERISEANIGIAGFGAKVAPARANPYLIDASPKGGSTDAEPKIWGTQKPGSMPKLFGAHYIAELNWYPDEGYDLVCMQVIERVQATSAEALSGKRQCYGCHEYVTWLAPDSRCSSCTRLSPDEV